MATFVWTGRTRQGAIQRGELEAKSREDVLGRLRAQQIITTSVQPKRQPFQLSFGQPKVGARDIAIFTRQFSTIISAGLPLVQGLGILATQADNKTLVKTLETVKQDVEGGGTLADALRKHPKMFDTLYVNMVEAGEAAGILDTVLSRLAKYIEKSVKLTAKVKSAMIYPIVMLAVAVGVISILLIFVIPIFEKIFADMGGVLPLPTQFVVGLSHFLRTAIVPIIAGAALAMYGLRRFYGTAKGQLIFDSLFLTLPVLGDLLRKGAVARFTRTLSTLLSSGVPILDGLNIVAKTSGNKIIENAIMASRSSISEGKTLSEPLSQAKVFPTMVTQMVSVGESTGQLDTMLEKIADFYDEEVDTAVGGLMSLLEPLLMVVLAIPLGFIIIAMYLPIFAMGSLM